MKFSFNVKQSAWSHFSFVASVFLLLYSTLFYIYPVVFNSGAFLYAIGFTFILLVFYVSSEQKSFFSPVVFFLVSTIVFVGGRGFLSVVLNFPLIEAGYPSKRKLEISALFLIVLVVSFMLLGYYVSTMLSEKKSPAHTGLILKIPWFLNFIFLIFSGLFLTKFFYESYVLIPLISKSDFLEISGTESVMGHINYFFYGKFLLIPYLFFSDNRKRFLVAASFLALSSIGFLFIGLRGYFMVYFMLFLFFFNSFFKINILYLSGVFVAIFFVAAKTIEYRLGYSLYDGFLDLIFKTLHQQGASFEVLYGVVAYTDEVRDCMPLREYFSNPGGFGACVDKSRGVFWEYGGFASTFFAEIYYLGWLPTIILAGTFGYILKKLERYSILYQSEVINGSAVGHSGFILFLVLPNLLYYGRGGAFDFIYKFLLVFSFIYISSVFLKLFSTKVIGNKV
tara:strand:- start:347 stop:1699 length:1353 start_codon:yes stop_codon:yes gene_type:complete